MFIGEFRASEERKEGWGHTDLRQWRNTPPSLSLRCHNPCVPINTDVSPRRPQSAAD